MVSPSFGGGGGGGEQFIQRRQDKQGKYRGGNQSPDDDRG
jgi:hypothetical protein